jgi:hypothetical protein
MPTDQTSAPLTAVDLLLEQPCFAVNVQVVPEAIVQHALGEIQDKVLRALNLDLFRTTTESLHLSVFPLIWARGTYGREPRELWDGLSQKWLQGVARACDGIRPFGIRFSKLVATEAAVVLFAEEPPELHSVRIKLEAWGRSLRIPVYRPRTVHTTLFRYREVASLRHVTRSLQQVDIEPVHWKVVGISVRQEILYPSLAWTELLTIGFRNSDRQ